MKKFTFLFVMLGMLSATLSFAGNGELFSYDKAKVSNEMQSLTALENMVSQNQSLTFNDLVEANNPLVMNLDYESSMMLAGMSAGPIIPSFWWGCLFGPVGILVVYLVEDDRDQTMSAFWGCVVGSLVSGVGYGLYWGLLAASN